MNAANLRSDQPEDAIDFIYEGIEILIEDDRWEADALRHALQRVYRATLDHLSIDYHSYEISLLACDDARIAALNGTFRAKPTPTNILSWPAHECGPAPRDLSAKPYRLIAECDAEWGDLAIAYETCRKEAKIAEIPFENHITHLLLHGLLHLLGYDHQTDEEAAVMESIEECILGHLGIASPYNYI